MLVIILVVLQLSIVGMVLKYLPTQSQAMRIDVALIAFMLLALDAYGLHLHFAIHRGF